MPEEKQLLIVRKRRFRDEVLDYNLDYLASNAGLDKYQAKIALNGTGFGVLKQDSVSNLLSISRYLKTLGYKSAIVPTKRPRIKANNVKSFKVTKEEITFEGRFGERKLLKGARVIAVFAGLKGKIVTKLIRKASLTKDKKASLTNADKYKIISASDAVLDIYILPDKMKAFEQFDQGPFRFLPGKFNPEGLGKYATNSSKANLQKVTRLIKNFSGIFDLELDFGLFQLPGCVLEGNDDQRAVTAKLKNVSNFGWYLLHFKKQNEENEKQIETENSTHNLKDIAAIATAGMANSLSEQTNVSADSFKIGGQTSEEYEQSYKPIEDVLPAPPAIQASSFLSRSPLTLADMFWMFVMLWPVGLGFLHGLFPESAREFVYTHGIDNGLIFFVASSSLFYGAFRFLKLKRWMDNTPTSNVRSLAMGMVELKGTTERAYNLFAPATNTPCVYYRLRKYKRHSQRNFFNSRRRDPWRMISDTNSASIPFYLKDDTGRVFIEPMNANITSSHTQTIGGGFGSTLLVSGQVGSSDMKFVEEIIPEFAPLYVLGYAEPIRNAVTPVKKKLSEKLRNLKKDPEKLMKYDSDGDGQIDNEEWEVARSEMEYEALKDTLKDDSKQAKTAEEVVVRKPKISGLPFIIAQSSESGLSVKYGVFAVLMFVGALATTGIGTWFFLN